MEESVEKSCWGVTVYTLAIVVGLVLLASLLLGNTPVDGIAASAVVTH